MTRNLDEADFDVRRAVRQKLESLERAGVMQLPRTEPIISAETVATANDATADSPAADRSSDSADEPSVPAPVLPTTTSESHATSEEQTSQTTDNDMPKRKRAKLTKKQKTEELAILDKKVQSCKLCKELASTRTQTVFGVGNPNSRVVFFGEAPGADEDAQGEPFVGRAGKLLTKIIEAMGFQRKDVFILNTLKCRPPGNRNPSPEEVANCRPFFDRQLEIIQPEFIVCLGSIAAKNLLDTQVSIGKLRGDIHDFNGIKVIATYHPAYLLRNPPAKKYVWEDMKMLLREMDLPIPKTKA